MSGSVSVTQELTEIATWIVKIILLFAEAFSIERGIGRHLLHYQAFKTWNVWLLAIFLRYGIVTLAIRSGGFRSENTMRNPQNVWRCTTSMSLGGDARKGRHGVVMCKVRQRTWRDEYYEWRLRICWLVTFSRPGAQKGVTRTTTSLALKQRTIRRFYQGTKGRPSFSRLREEQVLESAVKSRSCKRLYVHAMCSVCTIHNLGPIVANSNRRIIQPTQLRHIKLPDPNSLVSSFRFICKIMQATITY